MSAKRTDDIIKVYLLGDSITQGLGSKQINFTAELAQLLGNRYEIINLACTGTTVSYANNLVDEGRINGNSCRGCVCVILYGNVDAQIRPNRNGILYKLIPKRYKGSGMLMPRPFYSRSILKRIGQRYDNLLRLIISTTIRVVDGTEQWVPLSEFDKEYASLLDSIQSIGAKAVLCSCVFIDGTLFPKTPEQYELFNRCIREQALARDLPYIDLYDLFERVVRKEGWSAYYNADHFHPNSGGYALISTIIANTVRECMV